MLGVTLEPEAVYDPPEEQEYENPQSVFESCRHREACKRLWEMHHVTEEEPWHWCDCDSCGEWEV